MKSLCQKGILKCTNNYYKSFHYQWPPLDQNRPTVICYFLPSHNLAAGFGQFIPNNPVYFSADPE